jgi:hypothetical protein
MTQRARITLTYRGSVPRHGVAGPRDRDRRLLPGDIGAEFGRGQRVCLAFPQPGILEQIEILSIVHERDERITELIEVVALFISPQRSRFK